MITYCYGSIVAIQITHGLSNIAIVGDFQSLLSLFELFSLYEYSNRNLTLISVSCHFVFFVASSVSATIASC